MALVTPLGFLRACFPPEVTGVVRIVVGTPQNFPEATYWLAVDDIHRLDALPFDTEGRDVFFTPHTFHQPTSPLTKADSHESSCLWIECDDEHFDPTCILPNPPSAVVRTSHGRHHAYWFLSEPSLPADVERINRTLAYKFLTKDRSGWHLTKLLRVPGFQNSKYDPPQDVELVTFEPRRRYATSDFSLDVSWQEAPADEDLPEPPAAAAQARAEVLKRLEGQLPHSVSQALSIRQRDRSRALWAVFNWCHRNGLNQEDAFQLVWDSPNNKYRENRFNSREALWRDIHAAFRNATTIDRPQAIAKIRQLRTQRGIPPEIRFEETARLVQRTMALEGQFYYAPKTAEAIYYTHAPPRITPMSAANQECATYLGTTYMLNGTTHEFKYVAEFLRAHCEAEAPRIHFRQLTYYDRQANLLYVTDYRGGIYRLDGTNIEYVQNGVDDGVFFRMDAGAEAYTPDFTVPPELLDSLFETVTLADNYNQQDVRFLLKTWFLSIFFSDMFSTRPILILEGPKGSGKSTAFKYFEWLIRGSSGDVNALPPDARSYRQVVRERTYYFLDGVDEPWKGLAELLSITATGTTDRQRILYTDNRIAEYQLRAFLGVTTMNAHWLRHDVADRAVILRAQRKTSFISEDEIKRNILNSRNRLWGALLQTLNLIVKSIPFAPSAPTSLRMADFARFINIIGQVHKRPTDSIVQLVHAEQATAMLGKCVMWDTLKPWLNIPTNVNRPLTIPELYNELCLHAARLKQSFTHTYPNPRAFANALQQVANVLPMKRGLNAENSTVLIFTQAPSF